MPASVHRLRPDEVVYRPLAEPQAISPIIMSTRLHDQSQDIVLLRNLIDDIYREHAKARQRRADESPVPTPTQAQGGQTLT